MSLPSGGEQRRRWALRGAIALAVAVAYVVLTQVFDLERVLEDVSRALGSWTYLLVGCFAFAETGAFVGLIAPGESVMLLGGAVAGQGVTNLYLTIAVAWFAACAGDTASFFVGRQLGREFLARHGPRFGLGEERLQRVDEFFARHGGKTIFLGRFVGFVRAFAPFIAGSSGMPYRAFVPYSVLGCGLWVSLGIGIGYLFSRSIDTAIAYAGKGALLLGALIVVVVGGIALVRFLRVAANRRRAASWLARHRSSAWAVALARRWEPQLRFLQDRLTPGGGFGLEFTSLMAVLAVSLYVVVAYAIVIGSEPGPTPGDATALEIVGQLHGAVLHRLALIVTFLGSGGFTWALAAVCAALLAARRHWAEFWVLLAGMAIASLANVWIKGAVDRARPEGAAEIATSGSSFPSGHATHSVLYVWLALTIVLRLRPGIARATAIVVAGFAVAALIGLSRVYLEVHYLSDVSGGWALGAAAFSLCAAVALVISQVRQNPQR